MVKAFATVLREREIERERERYRAREDINYKTKRTIVCGSRIIFWKTPLDLE